MVKQIPLTKGAVAIVDDEDHESLSKYKWQLHSGGYATRNSGSILMHREVIGLVSHLSIDHKDGNKLNNTKKNLRICSQSQNAMNCGLRSNNASGHRGVYWHKASKSWRAAIMVNYRSIHLGYFKSVDAAATVYKEAAKKFFPGFAK